MIMANRSDKILYEDFNSKEKMPITYTKAAQSISVKWSASHLSNNLIVHRPTEALRRAMFGISHKSGFAMVNSKRFFVFFSFKNEFRQLYPKMEQNKFKLKLSVEL